MCWDVDSLVWCVNLVPTQTIQSTPLFFDGVFHPTCPALHHADDVTTIQRQDQCSLRGKHECLTSMLVQWFVAFFKI